ncbi:MAG: hypothetical protein KAI24_08340 [Planctomycetes bacterium]|nr:hypothetical protein [Planctomycetota bacterium]
MLALPLLLVFAACGDKDGNHDHDHDHDHAGGDSHEAGEHGDGHGDEHGARKELGVLKAFDRKFTVVMFGEVVAGEEAAFELEFADAKQRISTVRGWIGEKSGEGSVKSAWMMEGETGMHGHVEVPSELLDSAQLWLDLEVDGKTETVSIAFR